MLSPPGPPSCRSRSAALPCCPTLRASVVLRPVLSRATELAGQEAGHVLAHRGSGAGAGVDDSRGRPAGMSGAINRRNRRLYTPRYPPPAGAERPERDPTAISTAHTI